MLAACITLSEAPIQILMFSPILSQNVKPDPRKSCGPYSKQSSKKYDEDIEGHMKVDRYNHDTIGMVAIDKNGDVAAGTSTNGAKFKIPG